MELLPASPCSCLLHPPPASLSFCLFFCLFWLPPLRKKEKGRERERERERERPGGEFAFIFNSFLPLETNHHLCLCLCLSLSFCVCVCGTWEVVGALSRRRHHPAPHCQLHRRKAKLEILEFNQN